MERKGHQTFTLSIFYYSFTFRNLSSSVSQMNDYIDLKSETKDLALQFYMVFNTTAYLGDHLKYVLAMRYIATK